MKLKAPFVILLAALIATPLFVILASGALSSKTPNSSTVPTPTPTPTAPTDAVSATKVKLSTTMGDITLDLYPDAAPLAVQNFVTLGKRGYYNGTIFHRVIADFMIQGGDPTGTGTGGASIYGTYFKTEINDKQFDAGALGVARTSAMNTNGSQFFITAVAYPSLNGSYTVMGHTDDQASLDIVTKIDHVTTNPSNDKPLQDVKVTGFEILSQ